MTRIQHSAVLAFLLALPIEAGNVRLMGLMLTPEPLSAGIIPKLLAAEWVFFHTLGLWTIDAGYRLLGTWKGAMIVVFLLAYLQTALVCYLFVEGITLIQLRRRPVPRAI